MRANTHKHKHKHEMEWGVKHGARITEIATTVWDAVAKAAPGALCIAHELPADVCLDAPSTLALLAHLRQSLPANACCFVEHSAASGRNTVVVVERVPRNAEFLRMQDALVACRGRDEPLEAAEFEAERRMVHFWAAFGTLMLYAVLVFAVAVVRDDRATLGAIWLTAALAGALAAVAAWRRLWPPLRATHATLRALHHDTLGTHPLHAAWALRVLGSVRAV